MDGLRGFASLRTERIEPLPAPPRRHCQAIRDGQRCGTALARGTRGNICMPCLMGEIDIPEWMVTLVTFDPSPRTIHRLAQMLTGEERSHKHNQELFQGRNEAIADDYAEGSITQRQLAEKWGLKRATIQDILGRKGYMNEPAKKAARQSGLQETNVPQR